MLGNNYVNFEHSVDFFIQTIVYIHIFLYICAYIGIYVINSDINEKKIKF